MTETTKPANPPGLRSAFIAEFRDLEIRRSGNDEDFTLTGYAAVYDKWSEELWTPLGSFREKIAPGAFTDALGRNPDVRLLFNHEGLPLARTKSNTLELSEDAEGLRVWARLDPESTTAKDLRSAMRRRWLAWATSGKKKSKKLMARGACKAGRVPAITS